MIEQFEVVDHGARFWVSVSHIERHPLKLSPWAKEREVSEKAISILVSKVEALPEIRTPFNVIRGGLPYAKVEVVDGFTNFIIATDGAAAKIASEEAASRSTSTRVGVIREARYIP